MVVVEMVVADDGDITVAKVHDFTFFFGSDLRSRPESTRLTFEFLVFSRVRLLQLRNGRVFCMFLYRLTFNSAGGLILVEFL